MATTAIEIVQAALRLIGVYDFSGPSTSAHALKALNMMLNNWGARGVLATALTREGLSVSALAASYTIGVSQTLNTAKPIRVSSAFIRDSNNVDTTLRIIGREEFDAIPDKTASGTPAVLFYDPGVTQQTTQVGTIYLYPRASAAYTLFMESEKLFSELSTLSANMTFPLTYERAIKFNMAIELAPEHGKEVSQEVVAIARESLDAIIRANMQPPRANVLDAFRRSRANILSGDIF